MTREASAHFSADPRSAGQARRFVTATLEGWELAHLCEPTVLLTSEMVANAVLHARSPVTVRLRPRDHGVLVDVTDESPVPPRLRSFSPEAATGRGLRLLEGMAAEWGVERASVGKRVWFRVVEEHEPAEMQPFDIDSVEAL